MTIWPMWDRNQKRARKNARRLDETVASLPSERRREHLDIGATLQRGVQYVLGADVEGDLAEFGTASGFTSSIIARTITEIAQGEGRKLWLFDSFEGLPLSTETPDTDSPHVQAGVWGAGTCIGLTARQLHDRISQIIPSDRLIIREGWFADTVKAVPANNLFGMLHVDGDLYQSAIDCLTPLLERRQISEGALVIFDDWNCNRASNKFGERRAWAELIEKFEIEFEDFGHFSWAGRSFIVHGYSS